MVTQRQLYPEGTLEHARPVLKWAGGKRQLLPLLRRVLPHRFCRYFEPFLGGGALFFDLAVPGAVGSDSNADLIQFYEVVRDHPEALPAAVASLPITRHFYYALRSQDPTTLGPIQRAARFIYLNKTCYNGLYRVNRKGQFNTPFGGRTDVKIADPANLRRASQILRSTEVLRAEYRDVVGRARPGDLVYLDPPYLPLGGYSDFRRYTEQSFGEADHVELAEEFRRLTARGVMVLLSNSATDTIERLYGGFPMLRVKASRAVNCRADGRGRITELLIANYSLTAPHGVP